MTYTSADDEKLIHALRLRDRGHTVASIARAFGMLPGSLATRLRLVDNVANEVVCAVPGCCNALDKKTTSGVCREHNHARGVCRCSTCTSR